MSRGYEITAKEHAVTGGVLVANNADFITLPELINYGVLIAISIQVLYTLWKWSRDYRNHRYRVSLRETRLKERFKKEESDE
ncbi:MAG: hypothetical protein ACRC9P_06820 [Bacteroides sp.]